MNFILHTSGVYFVFLTMPKTWPMIYEIICSTGYALGLCSVALTVLQKRKTLFSFSTVKSIVGIKNTRYTNTRTLVLIIRNKMGINCTIRNEMTQMFQLIHFHKKWINWTLFESRPYHSLNMFLFKLKILCNVFSSWNNEHLNKRNKSKSTTIN